MRRLAILAAAAALGVAALLLAQRADSDAERVATPSPSNDLPKPHGIDGHPSMPYHPQTSRSPPTPPSVHASFQSDLASALGSDRSDLLSLFQRGTRAGATAGEQYVAHEIVGVCLSSILRMQHAQFPEVSGDTIREVDSARATLTQRCSAIERLGTDQILRDFKVLRAAVLAEGSILNSSSPSFSRARSDVQRQAVVDRLARHFSEFGPVALQWEAGEFFDYLDVGTSPFAQQIREMSNDKTVLRHAVSLALCMGSDICGGGGLLYLMICSETAKCGGSYLDSLSAQVTGEQNRLAQPIAKRILDAINTSGWKAPS